MSTGLFKKFRFNRSPSIFPRLLRRPQAAKNRGPGEPEALHAYSGRPILPANETFEGWQSTLKTQCGGGGWPMMLPFRGAWRPRGPRHCHRRPVPDPRRSRGWLWPHPSRKEAVMPRSRHLLMAAASLAIGAFGCAHCDTCDDFPVPCTSSNCGYQQAPDGVPYPVGPAVPVGAPGGTFSGPSVATPPPANALPSAFQATSPTSPPDSPAALEMPKQ